MNFDIYYLQLHYIVIIFWSFDMLNFVFMTVVILVSLMIEMFRVCIQKKFGAGPLYKVNNPEKSDGSYRNLGHFLH